MSDAGRSSREVKDDKSQTEKRDFTRPRAEIPIHQKRGAKDWSKALGEGELARIAVRTREKEQEQLQNFIDKVKELKAFYGQHNVSSGYPPSAKREPMSGKLKEEEDKLHSDLLKIYRELPKRDTEEPEPSSQMEAPTKVSTSPKRYIRKLLDRLLAS